jgi:hypothetical protein
MLMGMLLSLGIQGVSFMISPSTALLSHKEPASAGITRDRYCVYATDRQAVRVVAFLFIFFKL